MIRVLTLIKCTRCMPINCIQKSADNITPSSNNVIGLHKIEWDNCQNDSSIAWEEKSQINMINMMCVAQQKTDGNQWSWNDDAVAENGWKISGFLYAPIKFGMNKNIFSFSTTSAIFAILDCLKHLRNFDSVYFVISFLLNWNHLWLTTSFAHIVQFMYTQCS